MLQAILWPDDLLQREGFDLLNAVLFPDDLLHVPVLGAFLPGLPGVFPIDQTSPSLGWVASGPVSTSSEFARKGTRSLYFNLVGLQQGRAWTANAFAMQQGAEYWIGGSYYARGKGGSNARVRVTCYSGEWYVLTDGRDIGLEADVAAFPVVLGEWRRFALRFVSPFTAARVLLIVDGASDEQTEVWIDGIVFDRVWGDRFHAPRLGQGAIPAADTGKNDIRFGGARVGSGSLQVQNADGVLDGLSADVDVAGGELRVRAGGRTREGLLTPPDALRDVFAGDVQMIDGPDGALKLDARDARSTFHVRLPRRKYSREVTPNIDLSYEGKRRPLRIGARPNVTPIRIDKLGDYGIYELADCADAPDGLKAVDAVYAFLDDASAGDKDTAKRVTLAAGTDYSVDLVKGQLTILRGVHVREVVAGESDRLDFDTGGGALVAVLTPGVYTVHGLAAHVEAAIRTAIGGGDTTGLCTYSDVAHKITAGRTSGTFTARLDSATAVNRDRSGWRLLGFTASANKSGSSSYLGDDALFVIADLDRLHILRADVQGYKDDAVGTFTGTPNALITRGPDIAKLLWVRYLRRSLADVDEPAIAAARALMPEQLAIHLNEETGSAEVFDALELSSYADMVIDADGRLYFQSREETTLPEISLRDADFLSYSSARAVTDVFDQLIVEYDRDASSGQAKAFVIDIVGAASRFKRTGNKTLETFHTDRNAAGLLALKYAALVGPGLVVNATVQGKLLKARLGQRVRVTRRRDPNASGGKLTNALFRVRSLSQHALEGTTAATLVEASS